MTENTAPYDSGYFPTGSRSATDARHTAAGGMAGAAAAIHHLADNFPRGDGVKRAAHSAAGKLEFTGDYLRKHDGRAMLADVSNLAGRNPGPSLLIAASLGFLIGWAFRKA